jgi:hypothetical protein
MDKIEWEHLPWGYMARYNSACIGLIYHPVSPDGYRAWPLVMPPKVFYHNSLQKCKDLIEERFYAFCDRGNLT